MKDIDAADIFDGTGKPNVYDCPKGHKTVTVDRAKGVTPFLIECPQCPPPVSLDDLAQSRCYNVPPSYAAIASHEWYRPEAEEIETLSRGRREHVENGGLLLRAIKPVVFSGEFDAYPNDTDCGGGR
jgi:hypothetical protein